MAEIELNVLTGQCLNRRIDDIEAVKKEVAAWQKFRNNKNAKVNWQKSPQRMRELYFLASIRHKIVDESLGRIAILAIEGHLKENPG